MSSQLSMLLASMFPAALLAVFGLLIRINGLQGYVHGIVDWNMVDELARRQCGRMIGNILLGMAALLAGHNVLRHLYFDDVAIKRLVNMVFIASLALLVVAMVFVLVQLYCKNRTHGRR